MKVKINPRAGLLSEPLVALGLQLELETAGILFDDFLLETDEVELVQEL